MKRRTETMCVFLLSLLFMVALAAPASAAGPKPKDFVSFNGRIAPTEQGDLVIPAGRVLIITDVVIQNRKPGDAPADASQFTTVALSGNPLDIFLNVVGSNDLVLHFATGIQVQAVSPRIANLVNSTAPFIEYVISGYLVKRPKGF
jgi:hypothetical protein